VWVTSRVIVTGGAGFIGSHVCKQLASRGYSPVCVDSLENGYAWAVRWGPLEQLDVRDEARLDDVFRRHQPAAVMHFASYIQVAESVREPLKYHRNNLEGVMAVASTMQRHGVAPIVFSSTAAVYGEPEAVPIPERHLLRPPSPYGSSKVACERVLSDIAATGRLRYAALRYFNAAGADPASGIGEAHVPETHLIPLAVRAVRDPGFTLDVFGQDFPTRDGTAVRDYIHVDDLADAHVRALERLLQGAPSLVLNLGTGTGTSVREVIDACTRVLDREPKHRIAARRPGDVASLVADPTRAHAELGWMPTRSDIDSLVRSAGAWDSMLHGG
jgi:UDP-arabinose 4-epimerase